MEPRPLLRGAARVEALEPASGRWTPERLRRFLDSELAGAELIVVSNREPYAHELADGRIELHQPASGLVTALEPVMRACSGTWIAHGSGSADREVVDDGDRVAVPRPSPPIRCAVSG
uniref:CAZy families GT20 protein n=1 Tax=uncultured Sideroxydans sp. TaxID=546214 RepID=A0A060BZF0_9PROT|nr:CAZy families GT20 protein [uncultured Sideroxydans sp.]